MRSFEKIIELLEKKTLSEEDSQVLNSLIENDTEARQIYDTYRKLGSLLKSEHISYDDLRDYILFKNNIEPENKDVIKIIPQIDIHLKNCERCTDEFKTLNEEYTDLDLFIPKELSGEVSEKKERLSIPERKWRAPAYAFVSVIAIGFVFLLLLLVSNITTPANYDLASIENKSEFYVTRGRATNDFQESLKALEENNYDKAITHLQKDIDDNPNDETIFYSHYIAGLSYLEKADNSFLGLFRSFDKNSAKNALENFRLCIEKNNSGLFPDITFNAYFYSAKANIMLGDIESAKEYLKIVIEEKGSKMFEAQSIMSKLE